MLMETFENQKLGKILYLVFLTEFETHFVPFSVALM